MFPTIFTDDEKNALMTEINMSIHQLEEKKRKIGKKKNPEQISIKNLINNVNDYIKSQDQATVDEFLFRYKIAKETIDRKDFPIETYSLFKSIYMHEGHFDSTAGRIIEKHKEGRYLAWALNYEIYSKMHEQLKRIRRSDNVDFAFPHDAISCFIRKVDAQNITIYAVKRGSGKKSRLELLDGTPIVITETPPIQPVSPGEDQIFFDEPDQIDWGHGDNIFDDFI